MNVGIISMRYAKAFIAFASENGVEDIVYKEVDALSRNFMVEPTLRKTLDNPVLQSEEKFSLVCNAAGAKVSQEFISFIKLVLGRKREKHLQSICLMYIDLYRKQKNITLGKLTTAWPVSKETEDRMKQMVIGETHGTVEFETKVDPEIEGGFIFEIGTYRLDASIATQFRRVKQQFIEKNRRIV